MISLCPRVRFPFLSRLCQNYLGNENRTQGYEVLTEMCAYQAGKYPEFRIPEQFRFEFRLRICPNNGTFRPENPAIRGIPVFRGISFRCDGQIDRNRKRKKHPRRCRRPPSWSYIMVIFLIRNFLSQVDLNCSSSYGKNRNIRFDTSVTRGHIQYFLL